MEKKKRNSMYDPIYVSKRDNISIEEANKKIQLMKRNKSTSLIGFIYRHGEELGKIKFKEFQESSKHTYKKYINKYGNELGNIKWSEYLSKKDSTSFNWALSKANGDNNLAKELHKERINGLSLTYDINYFIDKYGVDNAEFEMNKFKISKDTSSYNWALSKASGDFKLADEIYYKRCESKSVMFGNASKESMLLFNPLIDWLMSLGIKKDDIYCGIENSHEIFIYDKKNKKRYYYDFCIKSIKLIIEYNGEKFHPNYEKYSIDYINQNWVHPYNKNLNVNDLVEFDKRKIDNAINNGYEIHIVWSSDSNKLEKLKNIIKNKIYNENKKN